MRKTSIALLVVFSLVSCLPAFASGGSEITLRGYAWHSTFSQVHEELKALSENSYASVGSDASVDSFERARWSSMYSDDRVENGGVSVSYGSIPVAGYIANTLRVFYVYPFGPDGRVNRDDALSEMNCAIYTFEDMADMGAVYNDLLGKLTSLYGNPKPEKDKYIESMKWLDENNNLVWLIIDDRNEVRLAYAAGDCQEKLAALKAQIIAEQAEKEAAEREANTNNTSGL